MSEEQDLAVVEQKQVAFYGDEVLAVRTEDGSVFVPVRPICDLLGVDWSAQRRRINRDPVLNEEMKSIIVTVSDSYRTINREVLSLPLDYISGFLFGIDANRVKPELKERLIRYQRECYKVLAEAFHDGRLTADPTFSSLLERDTPAAQAYKMATAIMKMAQQQLMLEAQIQTHTTKLTDHEQRLEEIESTLGDPGRFITPDQAMQISQAIKVIATEIQKRTKQNEYGKIYGQLYRQFGITSYKQLPANKFAQAMTWLTDFYRQITGATGDDLPF
ncbi:MAG: ORF6C domain-containing protein [Anaerolineales bacterium]|nr:ORF6C domain-containing protein [Anaerolineales bacterium]